MSSVSRYWRCPPADMVETREIRKSAHSAGTPRGIDKIAAIIYSRAKGKEVFHVGHHYPRGSRVGYGVHV
jgi:hypothetical protein